MAPAYQSRRRDNTAGYQHWRETLVVLFVLLSRILALDTGEEPVLKERGKHGDVPSKYPEQSFFPSLLTLSIQPYLSGSCDMERDDANRFVWGYFFDDSEMEHHNRELYTIHALSQPDRPSIQQSAARAAVQWLQSNQEDVFRTIFLLGYQPSMATVPSLDRLDPSPPSSPERIHVILRERADRAISTDQLAELRHRVITGGDTWDGGVFGSFVDMDTKCQLRLTLCSDMTTDWVGLASSRWPPPKRECQQPMPQLYNGLPRYSEHPQSAFQIVVKALMDWWWPIKEPNRNHKEE